MSDFWSELKRRNVVRVGIAYCAAGWLVIQVATTLFATYGAAPWLLKFVTTLVILGLPLALAIAWAFELTPQGLKRTDQADAGPAGRRSSRRWIDLLIIAVIAVAASLFARGKFDRDAASTPSGIAVTEPPVSGPPTVSKASRYSIVVLPFVNASSDADQEFFSDGITEDLMTALARFKPLKVAARSSAFSFKGKQVGLKDIGLALNVGTVLEGSVRRSGDRLRITAQLSDVESGYQLWSETYDRTLTDIFVIQDDITARIVEALQLQFEQQARHSAAAQAVDPEVYQLVLLGRFHWNQRTPEGLAKAAELLQDATRRAPGYAPGYSALADVYLRQFDFGLASWEESTVRARAAATKALELDEGSAAANTSLAHILLHEWQWQAAEERFLRAIELDPSYTLALHWYAMCLTALGRADEAVEAMQQALQLDPLSVRINADLGMAMLAAGRYEDAVTQEGRALEFAPEAGTPRWIRGMALEQLGRFEAAERDMQAALEVSAGNQAIMGSLGHLYAVSGDPDRAREMLAELAKQADETDAAFYAALVCAGLEDTDAALGWLERAVEERSGSVRYLRIDPRLAALRDEPRYRVLMERVGLPADE